MTAPVERQAPCSPPIGRALLGTAALSALAAAVAAAGVVTDPQFWITGAPAWLKPLKFGVSIALYSGTVHWALRHVRTRRRAARVIAGITGVSLIGELALIDLQVLRGRASHFNTSTPPDAAIFAAMGVLAATAFGAAIAAGIVLTREPDLPEPLATGVRAGVAVSVLGMAEAALMIAHGGHTVGADGGAGLALTGWSTDHGDLRIAHFVGLHALQGLPLIAWAAGRMASGVPARVSPTAARNLTRVAAVTWSGLVVLLTWQAELGRPLQRPGRAVATGALALIAGTGAGTRAALRGRHSAVAHQ